MGRKNIYTWIRKEAAKLPIEMTTRMQGTVIKAGQPGEPHIRTIQSKVVPLNHERQMKDIYARTGSVDAVQQYINLKSTVSNCIGEQGTEAGD